MSTPIINFATAYQTAINAGQSVVEGNVVKIIADSGAEIGNATFKVVQGGNGVASEVGAMTTAVEGGSATTTGLGFLTLDVGVVGAMVAPALGILAGVGLYNLAPEFWTNVSNALVNAGVTVGGKVVAWFDGLNVHLDDTTIETLKSAFYAEGIFEDIWEYDPEGFGIQYETAIYGATITQPIRSIRSNDTRYYSEYVFDDHNVKAFLFQADADITTAQMIFFSENNNFGCTQTIYPEGTSQHITLNTNVSYTHDGKTIYGHATRYPGDMSLWQQLGYNSYTHPTQGGLYEDVTTYIMSTGVFAHGDLQEDATFPDNRPFTTTYPDWLPWEYPQTIPSQDLPAVYPLQYPEIGDNPFPNQSQAQEPNPENVPELYPRIIPDLDLSPSIEPSPSPSPDLDPSVEPEPMPTPETPSPSPDPINPNPDPTPSPALTPITLPTSVSSSKLFTVYNPSDAQLDALGGYLWDSNIIEIISKMWQNPLDGIISLIQVYATPSVGNSQHIILGYLDSEVSAPVVNNQFVTIDCGSIDIDELKHNATDYTPFTSVHLFLPFIGFVELDVNDFMGGEMSISYNVDVYTGTCLATVSVTRTADTPNGADIYQFSGNCAQQIPLTGGNATGVLSSLISAVGAGLSIASGGSLGVVAGATMIGKSLTHEMLHVSHSGNLSANAGILGGRKPYLVINRKLSYDANGYNSIYGYPSNKTVKLGNYINQYLRVKAGFLKTCSTKPEHDIIMSLLKDGVIM